MRTCISSLSRGLEGEALLDWVAVELGEGYLLEASMMMGG